jgi:hypothetical protein
LQVKFFLTLGKRAIVAVGMSVLVHQRGVFEKPSMLGNLVR